MTDPASGPDGRGWALWRWDDNGNGYLVGHYADRASAETEAARLASGGHRQRYEVRPVGPEDATPVRPARD